ncbi:S-methyl-5-thioribose kinase [Bradyrhizobium sp. AZCC 1588]
MSSQRRSLADPRQGDYRILHEADLRDYLAGLPAIAARLGGDPAAWLISEVGDGNLNLVFIVKGAAGGVAVKQALPYVRLVGESWPLPLSRSHYEYLALTHQARLAPSLVPAVLHHNEALALVVMELLEPHIIMRKGLVAGSTYPRFVADVTTFLARTLFLSSDLAVSAAEKKEGIAAFAGNHALCKITEDLIFTDPYRVAEQNRWTQPWLDASAAAFREDLDLHIAISRLKLKFLSAPEALIHGDLHTGSIMVTESETKVIDPEFAFYGPMGFDIGAVIANLLMAISRPPVTSVRLANAARSRLGCWRRSRVSGQSSPTSSWSCGERKLQAMPIRGRCSKARPALSVWMPSGRPIWRGCLRIPSDSRRQKSFAVFWGLRTTSISN